MILHAGLIARRLNGYWHGVLIEGPAGAGKSDLALRALDLGFRLVSDDRTQVFAALGRLFGRAPDSLSGQIEVRGLGVVGPVEFFLLSQHLKQQRQTLIPVQREREVGLSHGDEGMI